MSDLVIDRLLSPEYPELLREIATELFIQLVEEPATQALGDERLAEISYKIAEHLRRELGGVNRYVPRGALYDCSMRDQEIYKKFRGDYLVLAREYNLTEMRIRQIIDRVHRAEKLKRQGDLFAAKMAVAENKA